MKSTKPYEEEFKKRAVQLLRNSGKPAVQIARELGCTADSLRTWKRKYDNPLEGDYHTQRMHSSLNYLTPLAAEMAA